MAEALRRGIKVLPVLWQDAPANASLPTADELPDDIRRLANIQALPISRRRLDDDLERLSDKVAQLRPVRERQWWPPARIASVMALVLILLPAPWTPVTTPGGTTTPIDRHQLNQLDPCSLALPARTQLGQFGQFGTAALNRHAGNFDRCDITVTRPQASPVDVEFRLQLPSAFYSSAMISTKRTGSVTVRHDAFAGTECDRELLQSKSYFINVNTHYVHGSGTGADLCRIADVAVAADVSLLNNGGLGARTFDSTSLATVDACKLLTAAALTRAGVTVTPGKPGFGDWQCRYDTNNGLAVNLRFDQGQLDVTPQSPLTQIGSYPGVVEPNGDGDDGGPNCQAQIQYRRIDASTFEQVDLTVNGTQPPTALCGAATILAEEAAAHLPVLAGH